MILLVMIDLVVICMTLTPFCIDCPAIWLSLRFPNFQIPKVMKDPRKSSPPPTIHEVCLPVCRGSAKIARIDLANERVNGSTETDRFSEHVNCKSARQNHCARKHMTLNRVHYHTFFVCLSVLNVWIVFFQTLMQLTIWKSMMSSNNSPQKGNTLLQLPWQVKDSEGLYNVNWDPLSISMILVKTDVPQKPLRGPIDFLSNALKFSPRDCYRCPKNGALSHPRPPYLSSARD